jgi:hypothetical protein
MSSVRLMCSELLIIYLCVFGDNVSQPKQASKMRFPVVHAG